MSGNASIRNNAPDVALEKIGMMSSQALYKEILPFEVGMFVFSANSHDGSKSCVLVSSMSTRECADSW